MTDEMQHDETSEKYILREAFLLGVADHLGDRKLAMVQQQCERQESRVDEDVLAVLTPPARAAFITLMSTSAGRIQALRVVISEQQHRAMLASA